MTNINQMLFIHGIIILPDERILLRRRRHKSGDYSKWAATIEQSIFATDTPAYIMSNAVLEDLNINLSLKHIVPRATITPMEKVKLPSLNRTIYPFIIRAKKLITLKTNPMYQFTAKPFNKLVEEIMCNTIYRHGLSEAQHTVNTVHIMKEVHLKDVLAYVDTGK